MSGSGRKTCAYRGQNSHWPEALGWPLGPEHLAGSQLSFSSNISGGPETGLLKVEVLGRVTEHSSKRN